MEIPVILHFFEQAMLSRNRYSSYLLKWHLACSILWSVLRILHSNYVTVISSLFEWTSNEISLQRTLYFALRSHFYAFTFFLSLANPWCLMITSGALLSSHSLKTIRVRKRSTQCRTTNCKHVSNMKNIFSLDTSIGAAPLSSLCMYSTRLSNERSRTETRHGIFIFHRAYDLDGKKFLKFGHDRILFLQQINTLKNKYWFYVDRVLVPHIPVPPPMEGGKEWGACTTAIQHVTFASDKELSSCDAEVSQVTHIFLLILTFFSLWDLEPTYKRLLPLSVVAINSSEVTSSFTVQERNCNSRRLLCF